MKDHWVEKFGPKKIFVLMTASFMQLFPITLNGYFIDELN